MIYVVTNNAIMQKLAEYSHEIQNIETADQIVFLMIYISTLLYTLMKAFSQNMP